jgi:hypothetical protein
MPGPITWSGPAAAFPAGPAEPGVYLIRVMLKQSCRVYVGETGDLLRDRTGAGRAGTSPLSEAVLTRPADTGEMPNKRLRALLLERGEIPDKLAEAVSVDPKTVER